MKELIRKILRESENDFRWTEDLYPDINYEPGALYYKYGDNKAVRSDILKHVVGCLRDLENRGDRIIMKVDGLCDFTELFDDGDANGYINKYLATKMFCEEDDWWEPYYTSDLVPKREWKGMIWNDLVISNQKVLSEILNHIQKKYVIKNDYNPNQLDIFGELPKKQNVVEIKGRVLDEDYFYELKNDLDELGDLIDEEDEFNDLKNELTWAYGDAYNTAARDEIWRAAISAVEDDFGKGEWKKNEIQKGGKTVTKHHMEFDVTDLFWPTIFNFFDECLHYCVGKDKNLSLDDITESCEHCMSPCNEYSYFMGVYQNKLKENDELYSPRFQEWPDSDDVEKYFIESVMDRI